METKTEAPLGSNTEPVEGKTEPPADESVDAVGGSVEDKPAAPAQQARPQITYPNHLLQAVITIALLLAMFLVALDMVRNSKLFQRPKVNALLTIPSQ
jgi:MFS transporter, DHA2 family, glioxin efflux transporter